MLRLAGSWLFPPAAAPRALRQGLSRHGDGGEGGERLRYRAGVMVGPAGTPARRWKAGGAGAGARTDGQRQRQGQGPVHSGRRWRPALLTMLPGDYRRAPAGPAFAAPAAGPSVGARPGTKGGASRGRGRGRGQGQGGLRLRPPPPTQGNFPSHVPQLHPELLGGMCEYAGGAPGPTGAGGPAPKRARAGGAARPPALPARARRGRRPQRADNRPFGESEL